MRKELCSHLGCRITSTLDELPAPISTPSILWLPSTLDKQGTSMGRRPAGRSVGGALPSGSGLKTIPSRQHQNKPRGTDSAHNGRPGAAGQVRGGVREKRSSLLCSFSEFQKPPSPDLWAQAPWASPPRGRPAWAGKRSPGDAAPGRPRRRPRVPRGPSCCTRSLPPPPWPRPPGACSELAAARYGAVVLVVVVVSTGDPRTWDAPAGDGTGAAAAPGPVGRSCREAGAEKTRGRRREAAARSWCQRGLARPLLMAWPGPTPAAGVSG